MTTANTLSTFLSLRCSHLDNSPTSRYPFSAITEYGEIIEAVSRDALLSALQNTQPHNTGYLLFHSKDGKWVQEEGFYFVDLGEEGWE